MLWQRATKQGWAANGDYLKERGDTVLAWAYKDCVLEGGQDKEDQKREEIFYNETLAPDEIDRLFEPKVLTKFKKFDKTGEAKVTEVKELYGKQSSVKQLIPTGISLGAFLDLQKEDEVDLKIARQRKTVDSLRENTQIFTKPILSKISLPVFPSGFSELLVKSIENVSEEAEEIIRAHMKAHTSLCDAGLFIMGITPLGSRDTLY